MYGYMVLFVYAVLMIGITVIFTKKGSMESFHVSDRSMGTTKSALSIAATWIWAPALFVSTEQAYRNGFAGLFWFLVPNVVCLILFIPFAKRIRREFPTGITLSGYMYKKYHSKAVKNIYLFQLVVLAVLSTAVQLLAGSMLLSAITGTSFKTMTLLLAIIAFSYSQFSGIKASVLTDAVQMVLILVTSIMFVLMALTQGNGVGDLFNGLGGISGQYHNLYSANGAEVFFSFGLSTTIGLLSGPFGDQCFWQRAFSIRKDRIGRSFLIGAFLFGLVPLSMACLGFMAAGKGFVPENTGMVNFEFIMNFLPKWTALPFLLLILSGLLSTIDSNLCAIASLTTDIEKKSRIGTAKKSMLILLVLSIAIANIPGIAVTHMFLIYGTFRATTLLTTVLTLKGYALTAKGVTTGIIAAMVMGLPIMTYGTLLNISLYKTIGSLVTVLSAGIIAVLVSKAEGRKKHGIR